MTGDYTFQWQYVVDAEDGAVSGRVVDLKGRARFGQRRYRAGRRARPMNAAPADFRQLGKQALAFALALGIWFAPIPAGLTREAWHLFAVFAAAIFSVIVNAFPLLTASLLAVGAVVLTRTVDPAKAFAGFANSSVLLVVVAFLVANAVVKSGLGRRISLLVVSAFGRSTLGLGYSIFLTDALIAPAFPSNTARGGVLYPIILSLAQSAGSTPEDPETRRLGGYLMFCGMASLSVSSALWLTATSANPIGVSLAAQSGVKIAFGTWLLAASVPALATILLLPLILYRLFPPGVTDTPDAPALARKELQSMGPLARDEWIVAVTFAVMVTGWVMADSLHLSLTAVAFAGLGVLLATNVLTLEDINLQGGTLVTFLWLAVLFALSGQLNELGFMGYVGGQAYRDARGHRLAGRLRRFDGALRADALHVREPVGAGPGAVRRIPRRRRAHRRPRVADVLCAAVRKQLLLDHHATGRQPERHLRRQQLPDPGRALPARPADHGVLSTRVPGAGNALAAFRREVTPAGRQR